MAAITRRTHRAILGTLRYGRWQRACGHVLCSTRLDSGCLGRGTSGAGEVFAREVPRLRRCAIRYFYDSEFADTGSTIDLISIGIVAEDGRELYLQSVEFDPRKASQWVKDHVLGYLKRCPNAKAIHGRDGPYYIDRADHKNGQCTFADPSKGIIGAYADCPWRTREQIKQEILSFMDVEKYSKPELHGWCAGYDWVAFCQLFGTMMDLPTGYPHYIRDLQQTLDERGISDEELPKQEEGLHHALADAKHLKRLWGYIVRNDCWQ